MKLRNLLVLGALLLTGSASAALVNGERPEPVLTDYFVETIEIDGTSEYYMYNVGAGKYWVGANAWGTQASVGPTGWKVRFSQHVATEGEAWDGKTVLLEDYAKNSSWLKAWFVDNSNIMYTDYNGQANYIWCIQKVGDYYRLSPSALNPDAVVAGNAEKFIGVNSEMGDSVLYADLEEKATNYIDWKFAAASGYESALSLYKNAQELLSLIATAKENGVDATVWETLYANESATAEEIEAALVAIKDAVAKAEEQNVDPLNPISKTSLITNPSYDANKNDGWSGTTPGFQSYTDAEHYNKTFDTWQVVEGLPNGLYKMTVQGFYRPSVTGATGAVFYAVGGDSLTVNLPDLSSEAELTSKPNNMQSAAQAFADGYYGVELYFVVTENKARIGVALPEKSGSSDWVIWDNWQLTYYGNKGEATYTGAVKGLVNAALAKFDGREADVTSGTIDTYKATLEGLVATDLAGITAAIATIEEAAAAVQTNIDGWATYNSEIIRGTGIANDKSFSQSTQMQTMAVYVRRQAPSILKAKTLSTEELLAEVANLTQMIEDAIRNSLVVNSDVTEMFLVNPKFEDTSDARSDGRGWEGNWTDVNGPDNNKVMEIYAGWGSVDHPNEDVYQVVKDAPLGVYEVSLNGFCRAGEFSADGYQKYLDAVAAGQTIETHAAVYVNNNKSAFKNVYDESVNCPELYSAVGVYGPTPWLPGDSTGLWFPNGMYDAGVAFAAGLYKSSAHGIVAREGDELRIGVVCKDMILREWVIFDNFQMIYRGKQVEYVIPHLQEAVEAAAVTLAEPMAKDAKELLQAAKANAEAMLNSTDEDAVFEALIQIYAANDSVEASAELFAELEEKANELQNAIMLYQATATEDAMNAATALLVQMMEALEGNSTKEEAQAMIAQVETVIVNLIIGNPADASDDNAKDFTSLLSCPSFEDIDGNGSAEGWTGAEGGTGSGAYEFYQKTFDLYQTLTNIPNGTYRIEVSAYERIGASVNDYALYTAGKDTATTFIYGASGEATYQKAVSRVSSAAILSNDAFGIEGCAAVDTLKDVEVGADSITWVPNSMTSAVTFFNDYSEYQNTVYAEVTDGTLIIGIKKEAQATYDWVMMDNWKLYYLGTNSQFKPEGIENVVLGNGAAVVGREIFTLGGAKVNKMEQGVYILRNIHADGTVTVKKVIK